MNAGRGETDSEEDIAPNGTSARWASAQLATGEGEHFRCGSVRFDLAAHVAWIAGRPTGLRPQEERLLALLWSHANRVVATDWLVRSLYGAVSIESGRTRLKRLVCDIRAHLGSDFASRLRTAPRHGLVLYATSATIEEDG